MATIFFQVDASQLQVPKAIYIVGNQEALGNWTPNVIKMYDDGTHGDEIKSDGIWSLEMHVPLGTKVEYKYTNSGIEGMWVPSEEFPGNNREIMVPAKLTERLKVLDKFGVK
jgi:hypothetical protein